MRTLPESAQKGGMGNRRETIRGADTVYMMQTAWELVLSSVNTSTSR